MASSYYSNTQHIDFDSVLAMDDPCMVSMFQALMASGLVGFLGCLEVIYEAALVDFFENASVRYGVIISTVAGQLVEISEEWFAESFDLPVDGLADLSEIPKDVVFDARSIVSISDLSEIPKDVVFDARSIVSISGEPVSLSGKKSQMKIEYRLLCDIMAKSISVKAGSFNAITVEKFSMLTAVVCVVRMNWASVLFNILKKMVIPGSKQAKGFAVQISLLLENISNLELGESSEFPASKILTEKTVHRYVSLNDKVGAEEAAGAPKPKAASKKLPAVILGDEPVVKNKRTMKKKSSSSKASLEIVAVAQEAVPIQMVAPSTAAPAAEEIFEQPAAEDVFPADPPADEVETVDEEAADEGAYEETADDDAARVNEPASELAVADIVNEEPSTADDVDVIIEQVLADTAQIIVDEEDPVVRTSDLIARWDAERPVVTASDTDEEIETERAVGTADWVQTEFSQPEYIVEEPGDLEMSDDERSVDELIDADEKMSLDEIIMTIPADIPLPSAGLEITKISMGKEIKIPGVDDRTRYLASLPQIPVDNKGKAILVEKDPVKGNPTKEHYSLICADIDLLVHLRAQVIEAVDQFFHSFSFKKLATINVEEMSKKEEQVLYWGETETTHGALNGNRYILLKYREFLVRKFLESWKQNFMPGGGSSATDLKVIDILSDLHLFVLEELREQALAHGLKWTRTCCSKIFEGSPRDRGAIIARTNTNTPSTCWLRTMIRVYGVWVVEPFCDQWVKIPRPIVCNEVSRHCSFVDFFPVVSEPFRILRKRWADVCLEVANFFVSGRLLPVGSINFCRSLSVDAPVHRVAPRQSPVFALKVSQFYTVLIDYSLFSSLSTTDIRSFVGSIASERTILRNVQIPSSSAVRPHIYSVADTDFIAQRVSMKLDDRPFSASLSDNFAMHFDAADIAASPPVVPTDLSASFDDLQTCLSAHIDESQSSILSKLHTIEHGLRDSLRRQEEALISLIQGARQEGRTLDEVQTLCFNEFRKGVLANSAAMTTDFMDVKKALREINAKVDAMSTRLDDVKQDIEATKEAISHQLLEFQTQAQANYIVLTDQLSELVNYINRGGNDKKGEGSSRGPQPPPADQIIDNSIAGGDNVIPTEITQSDIDNAQRNILERLMTADRERQREKRRGHSSSSYKRRRY
ncbi:hypothetical protein F511_14131 [Dorcoceras hygrometricum]|uniref:Dystroglycan-like n=1 Tax=Dorcoceras hygrometricum TaxID=472368 RepID=A0A2Z7CZA5_9LAMI|nr:hypothetical protein F511_14131 [Dorcoceras hygrometricum]